MRYEVDVDAIVVSSVVFDRFGDIVTVCDVVVQFCYCTKYLTKKRVVFCVLFLFLFTLLFLLFCLLLVEVALSSHRVDRAHRLVRLGVVEEHLVGVHQE